MPLSDLTRRLSAALLLAYGGAIGEARAQSFARRLMGKGFRALLVRSFAPGATESDLNLVLWDWGESPPSRLTLIDDENRLSR